jgi:hypothetical protein
MPTINNYSFSNVSYVIPENSNVSGIQPTAIITLTPNEGYILDASSFSIDPDVPYPQLQSVTFTQSGLNVTCTATFSTGFIMPSSNFSIPLCVIGEGRIKLVNVSGSVYNIIGENVEGDIGPNEDPFYTYYSNSGNLNESELVFTKTFEAPTGYYLTAEISMTEGNQKNYTIQQLPTYDLDGNLISITWNAYYIYPNYDASGDEWALRVSGTEIYVPSQFVTSYIFDTVPIYPVGETRSMVLYGSPGAVFSVIMTDSESNEYDIVIDGVIDSTGLYTTQVVFPDVTAGTENVSYEIVLSGDINPDMPQSKIINVEQYISQPTISITASSSYGITGFTTESVQGNAFDTPANLFINANWILTSLTSDISYLGNVELQNFKFTQTVGAKSIVVGSVVNSPSVRVTDATGIMAGDKFNLTNINTPLAPFQYEVTSVAGNSVFVSPNITVVDGSSLFIYRTNGNVINNVVATATVIDPSTINLDFSVQVTQFGEDDITFTLDLDEIIEEVI